MTRLERLLAALPGPVAGFEQAAWLWLLPPLAALLLLLALRVRPPALAWPALGEGRAAGARAFDPLALLGRTLRLGAVAALLLALAGPVGPPREVRVRHDGLDLLLVVDASGSMRALDARGASGGRTRLDLAREVVARFASHRVAAGDRVGLVVFGDGAFTQCPLTRDGALLRAALGRVEAGMAGEATALGDALALAVKRALAEDVDAGDPALAPGAGRLIVLLTDGRANAGVVPVDLAAGLAAHHGIRVHAVGIGSAGEEVAMARPGGGRAFRAERHDLDLDTLARVAAATGGRAFHARRSTELAEVYATIDRIERVPREAPPQVRGEPVPEPFLAAAGLLVALEILAARVVGRRIP